MSIQYHNYLVAKKAYTEAGPIVERLLRKGLSISQVEEEVIGRFKDRLSINQVREIIELCIECRDIRLTKAQL